MKRPNNQVPLIGVIFGWVLFGLVALLIVLNQFAFWRGMGIGELARASDPKDGVFFSAVTASLTVVGGIGAVAYLVIKYRERMDAERDLQFKKVREAETRLKDAVEQLGSESPQVRLAGVYALADVADTYLSGYKQRVVDILCGYLRTDRTDQMVGGKFKDAAVESAVLNVIADHMRKDRADLIEGVQELTTDQLWVDCSYYLDGVSIFEPVFWDYTTWNKGLLMSAANFKQEVRLSQTVFDGYVSMADSCFEEEVTLSNSVLKSGVSFDDATFCKDLYLSDSLFLGSVSFSRTCLKTLTLDRSSFFGGLSFCDSYFSEGISLEAVMCSGITLVSEKRSSKYIARNGCGVSCGIMFTYDDTSVPILNSTNAVFVSGVGATESLKERLLEHGAKFVLELADRGTGRIIDEKSRECISRQFSNRIVTPECAPFFNLVSSDSSLRDEVLRCWSNQKVSRLKQEREIARDLYDK